MSAPSFDRLFLHGFGDEPATWGEASELLGPGAMHAPDLYDPNLLRHERMPSLSATCEALARVFARRPPHTIVGHSRGGVLAAMLGRRLGAHCVLNIEGNLTSADCTLTRRVVHAAPEEEFGDIWGGLDLPKRYLAAVARRDGGVLRAEAIELLRVSEGPAAAAWHSLRAARTFLHGDAMARRSRRWLARSGGRVVHVPTESHWVQQTAPGRVVAEIELLEKTCGCAGGERREHDRW